MALYFSWVKVSAGIGSTRETPRKKGLNRIVPTAPALRSSFLSLGALHNRMTRSITAMAITWNG